MTWHLMLGVSNETGESQTHQIHQLTERRHLSFVTVSLPRCPLSIGRASACLWWLSPFIIGRYSVAVVGWCRIVVVVVVVNVVLAHGGRSRTEAAAETMVVVVEGKEDCICLVTGVQQTNNLCQPTGFRCIPFLRIPRNIPVSIPECVNSAAMIRNWNDKNSRPSCQSSFLQELGGHCKDLQ